MEMKNKMKHKMKQRKLWMPTLMIGIFIMICVMAICYVKDYSHSEVNIQEYVDKGQIDVIEISEGIFLDGPGEENAMIFYPGAKVEFTAYLPLFYELACNGIDCFLVNMPCNLAFLGQNKAQDIMNSYHYEHWYLAGHSLGGAMAASYASKNLEKLDGLVLLAAYATESLKREGFCVLSIYGSEDGVLSMEKLKTSREWMPSDYTEICIEGGNHAWFGNYGEQKGDHKANISREDQQRQTVDTILSMVSHE